MPRAKSQEQPKQFKDEQVSWFRMLLRRDKGTLRTMRLIQEFVKYLGEVFKKKEDTLH